MSWFSSSSKRVDFDTIEEIIDGLGGLRQDQKAAIRGAFEHYTSRGARKHDIKQVIHDLERDDSDGVGRSTLRRLEQELLAALVE